MLQEKNQDRHAGDYRVAADLAIIRSTVGIVVRALVVMLSADLVVRLALAWVGIPEGLSHEVFEVLLATAIALPLIYVTTLQPVTRLALEQAVASSEAKFRAIAQAARDGIIIAGANLQILFANRAAEIMFGYGQKEWPGAEGSRFVTEESRQLLANMQAEYLATESTAPLPSDVIELQALRKDGSSFPIEMTVSKVGDGAAPTFVALVRDVSARKKVEKEIHERTTRLNALLANNPLAVVVLDNSQHVQMCNPSFEKMFGYHAAEIAGAEIDSVVASEEMRAAARELTERGLAGKPSHAITRRRRKDGSLVEVEIHGVPLVMDGQTVGAYAIYQDLTERRKLEAETKQLELRYRDLFEQASDAILIFRPEDEVILDANPRAVEMYGFPRKEFIGMSLKKITLDVARGEARIGRLLKEKRAWDFETVHFRKNGEPMHMLCSGSLIDYQGETAIMGVLHDFTVQKRAAEAMQASEEAQRKLADQQKAILDALPVGVRIARQHKVVFANRADAFMHGYASAAELLGQDSLQQIVPEDRDRDIASVKELEEGGESTPVYYHLRRIRRDQTVFPAAMSVASINFDGQPALLVAIEDLTERQRLQMYEQILPVCCVCGQIRNDEGVGQGHGPWERLDHYVARHSDAQVSHTFCPVCMEKYRREQGLK